MSKSGSNMPICVFDIFPDGSASVPQDTALTGSGAYRWWHYDMTDPALAAWAAAHLPDIPALALLQSETRPRCDLFGDGLILNLRGINLNVGHQADHMVAVRMWITQRVVITVRVRKVFVLDDLGKLVLEQEPPPTPAAFIEALIAELTTRIQEEVSNIATRTEFFEADLDDETTLPPSDLPETRRKVIRLRRYLEPQRAALTKLAGLSVPLIPTNSALRLREWANRTTIAVEELDALHDRLITVQDEHDHYIARQQAKHGHVVSIAAAVFLPLGFLTGLFGVNVGGMPGIASPWAFSILCGSMIFLALGMTVLLRKLHWV